jgi:hypothetical protein
VLEAVFEWGILRINLGFIPNAKHFCRRQGEQKLRVIFVIIQSFLNSQDIFYTIC